MVLDVSVRCLMLFGLFWKVVVSSALTCGLVFPVLLLFRCCMMVMASSRLLLPVLDSCSCI